MSFVQDFLSLLGGCVAFFYANSHAQFGVTLLVGTVLGILCWIGCSYFSRLWNLSYRVTFTHHVLCLLAAILTLGFTLLFAALRYTREAAYASVQAWELQIDVDRVWAEATFASTWHKVKSLGLEDFTYVPPPGSTNSVIPATKDGSIRLAAASYAKASVAHFKVQRPFLSSIIKGEADVPSQVLDADIKYYFANVSKSYPPDRGISLAARELKAQLDPQVPKVVTTFRRLAVGLFLGVQMVAFGLVGLGAYKKLRVVT